MSHNVFRAFRAWSRRLWVQDAGLALGLLAATVMTTGPEGMMPPGPPWSTEPMPNYGLWWLATAVAVPALALRRRWPLPLLAVCALTAVTHMSIGALGTPVDLATPILLGTVAVRHSRRLSVGVLVAFVIGATLWSIGLTDTGAAPNGLEEAIQGQTTVSGKRPPAPPTAEIKMLHYSEPEGLLPATWGGLPVLGSVLIAAWAFGSRAKARRAWLDELTARARDLERQRDQRAALAVAAERDRISRELHDVVAHGLSVMVVQAQGGAAAMDNRPADTRAALAAIVETGRGALADMRRALAAVGSVDATREPAPGLADLAGLAERLRGAGTPVELRIEGRTAPLPSTVDLSAYRIAQEALTNTVKHAGPGASAVVTLVHADGEIRVSVTDDGTAAPVADGSGNGLRGMRERAELLGGTLTAGPAPGGGFTVEARLPIERRPR
ncbi:sensor histidine kinase [Phytomonospora endophytica]|uniref:histidine kinase n=1 Tax=Phytomonospora endophytica TaxID=714109 RepID=A0A841FGJ7_9ACTN|nr:sensor histidine kinase [Phytomonospora endophytica]MBB6034775.1 signal transduction histidine kinase [Phytomonospora endophytica]GIG69022.1 hypothetical protein Pen01_53170 [Phytomonospora endophytica]